MKKISVIIPVYNVEQYLDDCLLRVTGQSYTDLQILLIDDGSTDKSGILCDNWAARDRRIQVIHTANKGLSSARNTGLQAADGDYISFIDSDDTIHPRFLELMAAALEETGADMTVCREQTFTNDAPSGESFPSVGALSSVEGFSSMESLSSGESLPFGDSLFSVESLPFGESLPSVESSPCYHLERTESQSEFMRHFMDSFTGPVCWVWNKLYRKEILKGLSFPEGRKMEDICFLSDVALNCQSVAWISDRLYYYRQHAGSIMSMGQSDIAPDYIAALTYSLNRLCNVPGMEADYPAYVLNKIALLCVKSKKYGFTASMQEGLTHFCSLYDNYHKNIHGCKNRCKLFLARYAFPLYYCLRKATVAV